MKKNLLFALILVGFLPLGMAQSPDTAPGLTWSIALPEPNGDPCSASAGQETEVLAVVVANDGFIYTGERCKTIGGTTDSFVIRRISSSGLVIWTERIVSGVAGGSATLQSLSADPANRLWVWYTDSTQTTYPGLLVVKDHEGNTDLVKSNADFIVSPSVRRTSFEEVNATIFRAYAAGASYRIGYECASLSACTELYELSGDPAGSAHHAAPYIDRLYHIDLFAPTDTIASIVNQATGAVLDSETVGSMTVQESDRNRGWYNPGTDTFALAFPRQIAGVYRPYYLEFNATTLAVVRNIEPTDAFIFGYSESFVQDNIIDGDGNVFACGYTTGGAFGHNNYLMKFNATAFMGQRWNITWSNSAGSNFEMAAACDLAPDGSIYVGSFSCTAVALTGCTSELRKYAGAATSRSLQGLYIPPSQIVTPPATPTGGPIVDIVDFFNDAWGFDGSWLFGVAVTGMFIWPARNAKTLYIAIMAFLGVGVSVAIGFFPFWLVFVLIFLVIAVAGSRLFSDNEDSGSD